MKISIPIRNDYISDQYSKNIDRKTGKPFSENFPGIPQEKVQSKPDRVVSPATVLSTQEKTTLHMLFGSKKPEDLNFYNHNKVNLINRGHLIDVKG